MPDGTFDIVYQHYGPLTYLGRGTGSNAESLDVARSVLREAVRVLRPGGKLRVFPATNPELFELLRREGLRWTQHSRGIEVVR